MQIRQMVLLPMLVAVSLGCTAVDAWVTTGTTTTATSTITPSIMAIPQEHYHAQYEQQMQRYMYTHASTNYIDDDNQAKLEVIRELNRQVVQYQHAKLQALEGLNELLKELLTIQARTTTTTATCGDAVAARDIILQATQYIDTIEREYLNFVESQQPYATTMMNAYSQEEELLLDVEIDKDDELQEYYYQPQRAGFWEVQKDLEEQDDDRQRKRKRILSKIRNRKLTEKVPNRVYQYARPMKPMSTPGLPNYLGDTLYANLKVAQPALTAEFEKILNSVASNPSTLVTLKKNQPVFIAEYEQLMLNLKKNSPMLTAEMSQLIVDIKQVLVSLISSGSIGGGIM